MAQVPFVNGEISDKLANETCSNESLNQSNSMDKTQEPFLPGEEKGEASRRIDQMKKTSLFHGIGIIVGIVIGCIFVSPTSILKEANSIVASILLWQVCGFIALFGSLCYAELGAFIKKSGREYAYLMEAFGRVPAFLFAWTSVLIIGPASSAITALIFAEYVSKSFYPDSEAPTYLLKLLACSCLVLLTIVNCWSVKWATRIQDILTYANILCIVMIAIIGFVELGKVTDIGIIARTLYLGLCVHDSWNDLNYSTEEVKHHESNRPTLKLRSQIWGVAFLRIRLILGRYITVLGKMGIKDCTPIDVTIVTVYLGSVHWIVPIFVACLTFGVVNGLLSTSGRLVYVAARDGLLPRLLAMIHVKRLTPLPSLFFTTLISVFMLISGASSFSSLVDFFSFAAWLFYGATFAALLWLRRTQANVPRPYKVYIIVPIVMLLASIYLVVAPITTDPKGSLIALAIVLAGLPFYWLFVASDRAPKFILNATDKVTVWSQRVGNMAFEDPDTLPVKV